MIKDALDHKFSSVLFDPLRIPEHR